MASVHKQDKETQERNKRTLRQLLEQPGNEECMDCTAKAPTWASINLGIFVCPRCSGLHRQMGTHISQVRSTTLDLWEPSWIATMRKMGNANAKLIYEARLPKGYDKPSESENADTMLEWLRMKYEHKKYYQTKQSLQGKNRSLKQQRREAVQRQLGGTFSTSSESSPDASPRVQQEVSTESDSESDESVEPAPASPGRQRGRSFKDFLFEGMEMASNRAPPAATTTAVPSSVFDFINAANAANAASGSSGSIVPPLPLPQTVAPTPTLLPSLLPVESTPPPAAAPTPPPAAAPAVTSFAPTLLPTTAQQAAVPAPVVPTLIPLDGAATNGNAAAVPTLLPSGSFQSTLLPQAPSPQAAESNRPRTLSALKAESDVKKGIVPAVAKKPAPAQQDDIFAQFDHDHSTVGVPPKDRETVNKSILNMFTTEDARKFQLNKGTGTEVPHAFRAAPLSQPSPPMGPSAIPAVTPPVWGATPAAVAPVGPAWVGAAPLGVPAGLDQMVKSIIEFMQRTGCPLPMLLLAVNQAMLAGMAGGVAVVPQAGGALVGNGVVGGVAGAPTLLPSGGSSPNGESAANAALTAALMSIPSTAASNSSPSLLQMINSG